MPLTPMPETEPLLRVTDLTVTFPGHQHPAVAGVGFVLPAGGSLALVGESGSGKTATALALLQLLPAKAVVGGSVRLQGVELLRAPYAVMRQVRGGKVGIVFQEPMTSLNPVHRVGRQIAEALVLHQCLAPPAARQRVEELLTQVGLGPEHAARYPHQLSGGQRQRVMLAMALANDPVLLIADEPTTALDAATQTAIVALLQDIRRRTGMALLFITHDLGLARTLAEEVVVLHRGMAVEAGPVERVFSQPQHPYTQELVRPLPEALGSSPPGQVVLAVRNMRVAAARGWWRRREVVLLHGVQLTLRQGESVAVVGESGSGKTTLALAISRLLPATGEVVVLGQDWLRLSSRALRLARCHLQLVFQDPYGSLNPRLSIEEIVAEGLAVHTRLSPSERRARVAAALAAVDLPPDILHRFPHEFSGGQRQRIALARALVLKPQVLILDEPTSALDRSTQVGIVELLRSLQRQTQVAMLFITHDLALARAVCHRGIVLESGLVVEEGSWQDLITQPRHPATQALVQSAGLG